MYLFIGLGNPGKEYEKTRHNVGFMAVDAIADEYGFAPDKSKFHAILREGVIAGKKVIILKPQTYMNRSGLSVGEIAKFYKIEAGNITVFHDEIDLPVTKLRVKKGGGHGGHNGLRDIDAHIGKDYRRVRIGVGHPGDKDQVSGYVLGRFSKEEETSVEKILDAIAKNCPLLLADNEDLFMTKVG